MREEIEEARRDLIDRYGTAVYRYLRAGVRDADAADELFQDFSLRLVRGDFKRASPDKGRFRSFLKTSLYRMLVHYHRGKKKAALPLPEGGPADRRAEEEFLISEKEFQSAWRQELLENTWDALKRRQATGNQPLYEVLRCRANHPELSSEEMAKELSKQLDRQVNAGWVRKRLHEARGKFTALLIEAVQQTLEDPSDEAVQEELIDLGLFDYCRRAFDKDDDRT